MSALVFHLYNSPFVGAPELKALSKEYGLPLWLSEFYTPSAFDWVEKVHSLLADYDVSAVDYQFGYFGEASAAQLISVLHGGVNYFGFRTESHFHVFGNYSKFVRPGAVRVGVTAVRDNIKVSAFTRGGRLVIVAINSADDAGTTVRFDIAGLTSNGAFSAVRTLPESGGANRQVTLPAIAPSGGSIVALLPPRSVSTFYQSPP